MRISCTAGRSKGHCCSPPSLHRPVLHVHKLPLPTQAPPSMVCMLHAACVVEVVVVLLLRLPVLLLLQVHVPGYRCTLLALCLSMPWHHGCATKRGMHAAPPRHSCCHHC